jgi:hypothetical protein
MLIKGIMRAIATTTAVINSLRLKGHSFLHLVSASVIGYSTVVDLSRTPEVPRREIPVGLSVVGRWHGSPHMNPDPADGEQRAHLRGAGRSGPRLILV